MRFHANRDVFSDAVSFAVRLLPQRTTLPILSGVLIETTDDGLSLSSFDYEVSARVRIDAQVEEPGRVLVSGKLLADSANRLPGVPVEVSTQDNRVLVSAGSAEAETGWQERADTRGRPECCFCRAGRKGLRRLQHGGRRTQVGGPQDDRLQALAYARRSGGGCA